MPRNFGQGHHDIRSENLRVNSHQVWRYSCLTPHFPVNHNSARRPVPRPFFRIYLFCNQFDRYCLFAQNVTRVDQKSGAFSNKKTRASHIPASEFAHTSVHGRAHPHVHTHAHTHKLCNLFLSCFFSFSTCVSGLKGARDWRRNVSLLTYPRNLQADPCLTFQPWLRVLRSMRSKRRSERLEFR